MKLVLTLPSKIYVDAYTVQWCVYVSVCAHSCLQTWVYMIKQYNSCPEVLIPSPHLYLVQMMPGLS